MGFIKKHWSNILFFGLIIYMFTPYGMPLRALLIKGVSFITTKVESLEIDKEKQQELKNYDWQLVEMNGNIVNFSEFKGQVVLINTWATWCPPCIAEMPSFQKLYNKYKGKVNFLFIANDKPEKVKGFLQKNDLNIPVYFNVSNMPVVLQSSSIPTTFIIDKKGKIVVKKIGAADWNSGQVFRILNKYLAE